MSFADHEAWYHGSPVELTVLRAGSMVSPYERVAAAFAHKPTLISFGEDGSVRHDGQRPAILYVVDEPLGPQDLDYLRDTAQTHWQTTRDLRLRRLRDLPIDDPPQLTPEQIARMQAQNPQIGRGSGFIGDPDPE